MCWGGGTGWFTLRVFDFFVRQGLWDRVADCGYASIWRGGYVYVDMKLVCSPAPAPAPTVVVGLPHKTHGAISDAMRSASADRIDKISEVWVSLSRQLFTSAFDSGTTLLPPQSEIETGFDGTDIYRDIVRRASK